MTKRLYTIYLIFLLCLIQSCATVVRPESTEDKIYAGYAMVGASYKTIGDLAKRKMISKDEGLRMIARADEAKVLLDMASTSNETSAVTTLSFATKILVALEAELKAKGENPWTQLPR